ncbi:MAG TPA: DUF4280 domain-containing protein [Frankiaceae bacterium]|nr:DUF4280 domain-containing protein [Frankiaceae bacterium]
MGAPNAVTAGLMQCSFGVAPASLVVVPKGPPVLVEGRPAATVADMVPIVNVPPFGMCTSLSNPVVAAATAAALGVLTPMPCTPLPAGPWRPGAALTKVNGLPALTAGCTLTCALGGGVVTLVNAGATTTTSG